MKRYKYTCKNQEQHDLLAGVCVNLGYHPFHASWKLTTLPIFATDAKGNFAFCSPDSELDIACTEVADLREMIKFITGVRKVREKAKEPQNSWNIGGYTLKWEEEWVAFSLYKGKELILRLHSDYVKDIYNRGCQLGLIKQETKEQQK